MPSARLAMAKVRVSAAERAQAGAMGHCEIGPTRAGRQERNSGVPSCSSLDYYQILLKHGLCLMSTMRLVVSSCPAS